MTWVRIDTGMVTHHKMLALTPIERWHHLCAMAWTAENHKDGVIPRSALAVVVPHGKRGLVMVHRFVELGLWDQVDDDEWVIHDWLEYNISGERAKELKAQRADRQKRWRERRVDALRDASSNGTHDASPGASRDASPPARRRTRERPDPTRPLPEGEGRGQRDVPAPSQAAPPHPANDEDEPPDIRRQAAELRAVRDQLLRDKGPA